MSDYRPVSCALHSEFELAIMHGRRMKLKWHDEDGAVQEAVVRPVDLVTKNHEEFLVVEHEGERRMIRLDRISAAQAATEK